MLIHLVLVHTFLKPKDTQGNYSFGDLWYTIHDKTVKCYNNVFPPNATYFSLSHPSVNLDNLDVSIKKKH